MNNHLLSQHIVTAITEHLKVPPIDQEERTSYTHPGCLRHAPGIYSRNLALTRLVHGPLCYAETLVENNVDEVYLLSADPLERVEQVAQAYFEGIKNYLEADD